MPVETTDMLRELPAMLTMKHIQQFLGISHETARQIARQPDFPVFRHRRTVRVPREEFRAWLRSRITTRREVS
jgi:predicted DNA-binding transcriptional regulator AlpA